MLPLTPTRLGRYEIVDEIGKGAMGVVYLARDPLIGRLVALKTFRIGYSVKDSEMEQFRVRFMREAQSAGILTHPNIVTIHDVVEDNGEGLAFIAMEYVRGTNLKLILQGEEPLPLRFVLDIAAQVGDALDYAHSNRVVHRDVKPANILITADNRVKITDFGIARLDSSNLTQEGQLLGTPNYMAPEQVQGREVDHRADLFSLGVVLYEMLTRHKPFQGENLTVVSHRIVYDHFTPPREYVGELPAGVEGILARALEKDPARRFQRAREMVDELRRVVEASPATADPLNETQNLSSTMVLPPTEAIVLPPVRQAKPSLLSRWRRRSAVPPPPPPPVAAAEGSSMWAPPPVPEVAALPPPPPLPGLEGSSPSLSSPPELAPPPPADALGDTVATAAPPPPARQPISLRWLLAGGGIAALVLLLAYAGVLLWRGWSKPVPVQPTAAAEAQRQARLASLLNQGFGEMRKGHFEQAIALFRQAEQLAPGRADITRFRESAELVAEDYKSLINQEQEIGANIAKAKEALAAQRYDQATALATLALAIDPGNDDAQEVLAKAQEGQTRRARQPRTGPAQPGTQPAGEQPATTAAAAEGQPATGAGESAPSEVSTGTVHVHFTSDGPDGVLIVYVNGKEKVRDNFRSKGGLFTRRKAEQYEFNSTLEIPASSGVKFRVHIAPGGKAAIVKNVDGNIRGGKSHTLEIHLSKAAHASVSLY
jgi:serine/threonine protein kinase